MRIFLSVDMEGATGVCHRDHLIPGGQDYERARSWLTGDVNAAVEGALEAGATDVVVADGHGTMRNILLDELHDSARLVTGPAQVRNRPLGQLSGIEVGSYDAAMFIGYHSRAGTPGGLLSHTWVGALVHEIRLNGRAAGEALLNAALLGHYRVPVVFASGADDFCREVLADLGEDLEVVETKKILGPSAVITRTPAKARSLIRAGAARGL
ncbi:MAG: M55 family metallopeptidase, partial [Planctomycetota bacterium]